MISDVWNLCISILPHSATLLLRLSFHKLTGSPVQVSRFILFIANHLMRSAMMLKLRSKLDHHLHCRWDIQQILWCGLPLITIPSHDLSPLPPIILGLHSTSLPFEVTVNHFSIVMLEMMLSLKETIFLCRACKSFRHASPVSHSNASRFQLKKPINSNILHDIY